MSIVSLRQADPCNQVEHVGTGWMKHWQSTLSSVNTLAFKYWWLHHQITLAFYKGIFLQKANTKQLCVRPVIPLPKKEQSPFFPWIIQMR